MADADVAVGVDHVLARQNAIGGHQVFDQEFQRRHGASWQESRPAGYLRMKTLIGSLKNSSGVWGFSRIFELVMIWMTCCHFSGMTS